MAGDGRVGGVGQAELLQAAPAAAGQLAGAGPRGRSRRAGSRSSSARVSSARSVLPISLLLRPLTVDGQRRHVGVGQQRLLGQAAGVHQAVPLQRIQLARLAARRCRRASTILARVRSMLSPPSSRWSPTARALEAAAVGAHVDEGEVGGAAAHVEDQHPLARAQPAPGVLAGRSRRKRRPAAPPAGPPGRSPARAAASRVSSRAASSNEAGTVTMTSCSAKRASGSPPCWWSQAALHVGQHARRGVHRRQARARPPPPRAGWPRGGRRRAWHSQDLAEAIMRLGCSTPWLRASSPTTARGPAPASGCRSQGSAVSAGARSCSPAR